MSDKIRCEGWRRHGGAFTFGPVRWEQCKNSAVVSLTVEQNGERATYPACMECWNECMHNAAITAVEPLTEPEPAGELKVVVEVREGVASVEECPEGVSVQIIDWDLLVNGECPACGFALGCAETRCPECGLELE